MNTTSPPAPDSFVQVSPDSHFTLQNLPLGIGKPKKGDDQSPRVYSRIGNYAVDLSVFEKAGYFREVSLGGQNVFESSSLKNFIEAGPEALSQIQQIVADLLRFDRPMWLDEPELRDKALTLLEMVEMQLPVDQHRSRLITDSNSLVYHIGTIEHDDSSNLNEKKVAVDIAHEILLDHHGDRMLPEMKKNEHLSVKEIGLAYLSGPNFDKEYKDKGGSKSPSEPNQKIIGVTTAAILTKAHQDDEYSIIISPWMTLLSKLTPFISTQAARPKPKTVLKLDCAIKVLDHQLGLISENISQLEFPIGNPSDFFPVDHSRVPSIQSGDLMLSSSMARQPKSITSLSTMYPFAELMGDIKAESVNEHYVQISSHSDIDESRIGTGEMLIRISA